MNKYTLITIIIFSCVLSGLFLYNHRLDLNPDGVSYLEIAKYFKEGNFPDAINAYWAPLFSLTMTPLMFLFNPLESSKLVIFLLTNLWILLTYLFAYRIFFRKRKAIFVASLLLFLPNTYLLWTLITPDLLLSNFFLFLLLFFFGKKEIILKSNKLSLLFGLLVGIGAIIKSFFLPFALIYFTSIYLFFFKKSFITCTFLIFGISILPILWSLLVYTKYGKFTLSTNVYLSYKTHVLGEPFAYLEKPIAYPIVGTSYWSDPSDFSKPNFDSVKQLSAIIKNLKTAFSILFVNFHFGLILVLFSLRKQSKNIKILIFGIVLWIFLYSLILIEERYLWPIIPLFLILIVKTLGDKKNWILMVYIAISTLIFTKNYDKKLPSNQQSIQNFNISRYISRPCILLSDDWYNGLYTSYLSGCKFYGISQVAHINRDYSEILRNEINSGKVTHFISFNGVKYEKEEVFVNSDRSIISDASHKVIIYKIRDEK